MYGYWIHVAEHMYGYLTHVAEHTYGYLTHVAEHRHGYLIHVAKHRHGYLTHVAEHIPGYRHMLLNTFLVIGHMLLNTGTVTPCCSFPTDLKARDVDRQFLLGPALLVSPVLEPVSLLPAMPCCSMLTGGLQEEGAGLEGRRTR